MDSKKQTAESFRFQYRYKIGKKLTGSLNPNQEIEMLEEFLKSKISEIKEISEEHLKSIAEEKYPKRYYRDVDGDDHDINEYARSAFIEGIKYVIEKIDKLK